MKKSEIINIYTGVLMGNLRGGTISIEAAQDIAEQYIENL